MLKAMPLACQPRDLYRLWWGLPFAEGFPVTRHATATVCEILHSIVTWLVLRKPL